MDVNTINIQTPEAALHWFKSNGVNIRRWATDRNFKDVTVYQLLHRQRAGKRGESFKAAIALRLRHPPEGNSDLAQLFLDSQNVSS